MRLVPAMAARVQKQGEGFLQQAAANMKNMMASQKTLKVWVEGMRFMHSTSGSEQLHLCAEGGNYGLNPSRMESRKKSPGVPLSDYATCWVAKVLYGS